MKKFILSIFAICAMATASAQGGTSFGVKVGANVSSMGGDFANDFESSIGIGYTAGFMVDFALGERLGFGVELLYSLQGWGEDYGYDEEVTANLSYINIPILVNINIANGLAIKAGIQPGFLLAEEYRYDGEYLCSISSEWSTNVNTFALAVPVGMSYTFAERLVFDARYNIAISDVFNEDNYSSKNNVFQLTVGYKF